MMQDVMVGSTAVRSILPRVGFPVAAADKRRRRNWTGPVLRTGAASALAAAFALLLGAGAAEAQTSVKLVGNLAAGTSGSANVQNDNAQAFTTGAHSAGYTLTKVVFRLRLSGTAEPTYTVTIRSDSSGSPGSVVGTLTNPASLPTTYGNTDFMASGAGIHLDADTTYWLVWDVSAMNSALGNIDITGSDAEDGGAAAGWSIANNGLFRTFDATSWTTSASSRKIAIHGYPGAPVTPRSSAPEEQQQVLKRTLASVASRTVSSALDNIGARMGEAAPASGLNMAGLNMAGLNMAGPDGAWPSGSRGMGANELLGSGAFSLALGAAPGDKKGDKDADPKAPRWGIWGRGDFGTFAGRSSDGPDGVSRYDGDLRIGWLGADARETRGPGRWVAGLAVSRGSSKTDYVLDGEAGRIETDLTALWPYGRWTFPDGLEMRGLLGMGRGEARHTPKDGMEEKSDLTMWAASVGLSRPLPPVGRLDLSARGDASLAFMETATGQGEEEQAVDGLSADVARVRGGVEASRRIAMAGGAEITPFAEVAGRMDAGDGPAGPGVEVAGGLRYAASRVAVEVRGRWLAAHAEAGAKERGVSLTARLDPGAFGRGLSASLAPRWGAGTGGTSALWREELPGGAPGAEAPETGALDLRVGYGFGLFGGRLTGTPNVGFGASDGGGREVRAGWRLTPAAGGYAGFEVNVDATRRESAGTGEPPAHGAMLTGAMRW